MKDSEALELVQMILVAWPNAKWTEDVVQHFASKIRDLDPEHAVKGLARAEKEMRFPPSIAEFREYALAYKMLEGQEQDWRGLPPEPIHKPDWTNRWLRARKHGDMRAFPEQIRGHREMAEAYPEHADVYALPTAEITDADYWVQPDEYLDETYRADLPSMPVLHDMP